MNADRCRAERTPVGSVKGPRWWTGLQLPAKRHQWGLLPSATDLRFPKNWVKLPVARATPPGGLQNRVPRLTARLPPMVNSVSTYSRPSGDSPRHWHGGPPFSDGAVFGSVLFFCTYSVGAKS